ncbi:lytic transglycosylase domain-containing protein [Erythrobacter sp. BLCC-B19]|uniref:lytic transglycosylase domain-containing protein n=1 Tax=Erythrobacter sp. BLCC-B19 TaxID=3025315 RepID=UPI00235E9C61|nr:lytic transglycosylase domain-containing protein [Erythrobacter sp. BLCC-B19]WDA40514.1 lytic transglycosylase domain-containing protein [Erythrobacter sp. BLCC-B19]
MVGHNLRRLGKRHGAGLAAIVLAAVSFPGAAAAQSGDLVARWNGATPADRTVAPVLSAEDKALYRQLFAAIDAEQWPVVESLLAQRPDGVLTQAARAEYYTHAKSPKVSPEQIAAWFNAGTDLPQAEQLVRMGAKRGLAALPALPSEQGFARQPYAPKRILPRGVNDGTMPGSTATAILAAIKADNPAEAHRLLTEADPMLSAEARAEWRQRVAWSYYIENQDNAALELARTAAEGSGAWVAEGAWVEGLAAWRMGYCQLAGDAFARTASQAANVELAAAGHYWASRALVRCREPGQAQQHLSAAAQLDETLYGMLAADQLGVELPQHAPPQRLSSDDWAQLSTRSNAKVAAALIEIGRPALADEVLRHEARIGPSYQYAALSRLARELGLPSTQLFMAHNAPYGTSSDPSLRFPVAYWQPVGGWQVDPALAFAHALQESNFRAAAVSPANARGLMQIMPGTARDHSGRLSLGASYEDLNDPQVNLAYGQRHLEMLRDSPATGGALPKVMAAYNAGLTPVGRWNSEINDQNDPLLWMESIPYWETRGYVAIVMRNYWMYERAAGVTSPSRRALAQGRWPDFPQAATTRSARLEP